MSKIEEKSLIIRRETVYDKIRRSLLALIFRKEYKMVQRLEELLKPHRPSENIVIPKEVGKNIKKY